MFQDLFIYSVSISCIYYFLSIEFLGVKLKNIFFFWLIILLIICLDLFYQYFNGENILGYKSIKQGDFNRLGGFLDDELKISNLIIYFFVPVFSFFHFLCGEEFI